MSGDRLPFELDSPAEHYLEAHRHLWVAASCDESQTTYQLLTALTHAVLAHAERSVFMGAQVHYEREESGDA